MAGKSKETTTKKGATKKATSAAKEKIVKKSDENPIAEAKKEVVPDPELLVDTPVIEKEVAPVEKKEAPSQVDDTLEILEQIEASVSEVSNKDIRGDKLIRFDVANIDVNKQILCTSFVFGKLIYKSSKTGAKFVWPEFGTTEWMPFYEIQTMNNDNASYLSKPLMIINDPEVIAFFNLKEIYKRVAKTNDLEIAIQNKNLALVRSLMDEVVRYNLVDIVVAKLRKMRASKVLNDIDIMRILSEEYNIDLEI